MVAVVLKLALNGLDVEYLRLGPATPPTWFKSQVHLLSQVMLGASSHLFESWSPYIQMKTQGPT